MISTERNKSEREHFFSQFGNNLKGISLKNDKVMSFHGIPEALGADCASHCITRLDFPFPYTHENPFPVNALADSTEVDAGFLSVFSEIAEFFG
jgi:hypothetical protein